MKHCHLIIFTLLSGFTLSIITDNLVLKDIEYSKEFELDSNILTEDNMNLYFRLPLPSNKDNMGITFKAYTDEGDNFDLPKINLYTEKPNDSDIKNADISNWNNLDSKYHRKYKIYTYYTYTPDSINNEAYAVIYLSLTKKYKYFSILVSPFKKRTDIYVGVLTFNKEFKIDSSELSYTYTYFNLIVEAENHNKNESIIIKLSENDINDLEIELEGKKQMIGGESTLIKNFENYTSCDKNGDLITYKYNYGIIPSEHKYLSMVIKSKEGYMLNYFSIQVGNYNKIISLSLWSLISILFLIL